MTVDKNKLVRVRLLNEALQGLTGKFGLYDFENGVSEVMIRREAERLSVITNVEFLDDAESMWERKSRERGVVSSDLMTNVGDERQENDTPDIEQVVAVQERKVYTREQLEAVADKEGIAGLRKIGNELGVASNSIVRLIEEILGVQERV